MVKVIQDQGEMKEQIQSQREETKKQIIQAKSDIGEIIIEVHINTASRAGYKYYGNGKWSSFDDYFYEESKIFAHF